MDIVKPYINKPHVECYALVFLCCHQQQRTKVIHHIKAITKNWQLLPAQIGTLLFLFDLNHNFESCTIRINYDTCPLQ